MNHSIEFKDAVTGAHKNIIEGLWYRAKLSCPSFNRKKDHFLGYLCTFILYKNGKKKKTVLIYSCKLPLVYILANANHQTPKTLKKTTKLLQKLFVNLLLILEICLYVISYLNIVVFCKFRSCFIFGCLKIFFPFDPRVVDI